MPNLSQGMRLVTAFFGIFGVVQIASSLNVIAEWFVERARKRFMNKQRGLLKEAQRAGAMVREQVGPPAAAPEDDKSMTQGRKKTSVGAVPGLATGGAGQMD